MRILISIFMIMFLSSCRDDIPKLPIGFEHISKDGRSHFVYVHEEYLGERVTQRETGRTICSGIFKESDYCEVYYFAERDEVPTKFPIMNRVHPIGLYEIKSGKERFRALSERDNVIIETHTTQ